MMKVVQRAQHGALFVVVYVVALMRRRTQRTIVPRTLLLVASGKLGDVVCTTPVMRAIRQHLPETRLYVGDGTGINTSLLADSGLVDKSVSLKGVLQSTRAIRAARVDTVCITAPSFDMLAAALLARVPQIIVPRVEGGFCPQQIWPYRQLLRFVDAYPYAFSGYAPRERLRVLEPLGIHVNDTTKHLGYSDSAGKNAREFLQAHNLQEKHFAIISPSAGNKIKNWPAERFAQVAEYLAGKGLPVVVIGSARDKDEVEAMMEALANPENVTNALNLFSIDELKALIACAGLFVSVDTGPLYIAEAFGIPTVDIVGPVAEQEQPPRGDKHVVVVPERAAGAVHIMNARMYDEKEARRQTEAITVEMVISAIEKLRIVCAADI